MSSPDPQSGLLEPESPCAGDRGQNQTTSYAYDNQGNVTGITDPLNR